MLEDALSRLEHQVQAGEVCVLGFEHVHDPQRLQVVFKATEIAHARVEFILASVAERRMPKVMGKANGFC